MAFKAKSAASKPAMEDDEDESGMDASDGNQGTNDEEAEPSDEDEQGGEDEDEGSEVIATILKNEDGSYTLIHGDEKDEGEEGESGEDEDEGEEGEGEEAGPERQVFKTEAELLKGVLDCIRADKGDDEASAEHDFEGGYAEEKQPEPGMASAGRNSMY